jgi:hypothetical protein
VREPLAAAMAPGTHPEPAQGRTDVATTPATTSPKRRFRRGLKRTKFQVPAKMPLPVRALWQAASAEERERAHRSATEILLAWLGKATREEAAARLGVAPLRFWQLSQQAVAGMVAGLLRQPRARRVRPGTAATDEEDVASLRRRLQKAEQELDGARRLIGILRDLPANREEKDGVGTARSARASDGRGEAPRPSRRKGPARGDAPDGRTALAGGEGAAGSAGAVGAGRGL